MVDWLSFGAKTSSAKFLHTFKMAAGDENDKSALNKVKSPKKEQTSKLSDGNMISISVSDFTCPICLQILIEPVVMPCEHELCWPCFKQNVEEANFLCPLCRMRISSWARRNSRNGTLVNLKRWEQIQKLFPEKCQKRLRGEDDDEDVFAMPPVKRAISQDGELRKEYEEELKKLQQTREQEIRASELVVQRLQEDEQRLVRTLEFQAVQDEEFARKIMDEEREQNSQGKERLSQPSTTGISSITSHKNKNVKRKKMKAQDTQACRGHTTLDRWFLPTRHSSLYDNQGLTENEHNHNASNCKANTREEKQYFSISSSSTASDIFNFSHLRLIDQRTKQEEQDFQFALKLQKEFDLASNKSSQIDRKKGTVDAYLLRTVSQSEEKEESSTDSLS